MQLQLSDLEKVGGYIGFHYGCGYCIKHFLIEDEKDEHELFCEILKSSKHMEENRLMLVKDIIFNDILAS